MNILFSRVLFFSITLIILVGNNSVQAQWLTNGNNIYYNNGNVGIGTQYPAGLLHLLKSGSDANIYINRDAGYYANIWFLNGTSGTSASRWRISMNYVAETGSDAGSDFEIINRHDDGSAIGTPFYIKRSTGYIGMGTSTPTSRLDVNGSTRFRDLIEQQLDADFVSNAYYSGGWKYRNSGYATDFYRDNNGNFKFMTAPFGSADASLGFSVKFVILNNGNVGIGTSNPTNKLNVNGSLRASEILSDGNAIISGGTLQLSKSNEDNHIIIDRDAGKYANIWFRTGTTSPSFRWRISMNATTETGANSGSDFEIVNRSDDGSSLGTPFFIKRSTGNVGIGTTNPGNYRLAVKGNIRAEEIIVETGWSDFVFEKDYKLMPLNELETFVKENKHLPEIPTEAEVKQNGVSLGETQSKLLQKIEELTLYVIEQNKLLNEQNKRIEKLEKENEILKSE